MEQKIEVETPLGPVWLWGRGDRGLPILLVITGAMASEGAMNLAGQALAGVDVWRGHLPGNHCPEIAAVSVGAYAAAYSHALGAVFPDRPTVALGLSVGALVAMGLRSPQISRLLLVEPLLLTEGVWPLEEMQRQAPPGSETFFWNIFGLRPDAREPRDYTPLLDQLRIPAVVLIGQEPLLPRRSYKLMPSFVTDAARAALERHPLVRIIEAPGAGHNIPAHAEPLFVNSTLWTCRAAFGPTVQLVRPVDGAGPPP